MSYLDTFEPATRAINAVRSLENPSLSLTDPAAWEEAGLLVGRSKSGVRVTHKKALGHSPIWRGVNLIARTVARMHPIVYRYQANGGRERDKKHVAYALLRRKPKPARRSSKASTA